MSNGDILSTNKMISRILWTVNGLLNWCLISEDWYKEKHVLFTSNWHKLIYNYNLSSSTPLNNRLISWVFITISGIILTTLSTFPYIKGKVAWLLNDCDTTLHSSVIDHQPHTRLLWHFKDFWFQNHK